MSQSLLDDQSCPPEDDGDDARLRHLESKSLERFAESERRQADRMKALANQLQAQMTEMDKGQEVRIVEMARRQDAFSRWMVGLTVAVVVLVAHMPSRMF